MPAGNIGDLRIVHQFDQILLHFSGEEILIGQNQKDLPRKRRKIRFAHGLLMHQVGKQAGNMHILFLLVIFEDRLKQSCAQAISSALSLRIWRMPAFMSFGFSFSEYNMMISLRS